MISIYKKIIVLVLTAILAPFSPAAYAVTGDPGARTVLCAVKGTEIAVRTHFSDDKDLLNIFTNYNTQGLDKNNPIDFRTASLIDKTQLDNFKTGSLLSNNGDEAAPFNYNGSYIGANHGQSNGVLVTATNHGKTYADIGSLWADQNGVKWNLLKIVSANQLLFLSENIGASVTQYQFKDSMAGSLTYVSHGVNTGAITVEQFASNQQVYSAIRSEEKEVYAVIDGVRQKLVNGDVVSCDYVDITDKYDIMNPATIGEALRANRPEGGYQEAQSMAVGNAVVKYNMTYRIQADGTVLSIFDHTVLANVNFGFYGGIQYLLKNDAYPGGTHRYIPKTLPFTTGGTTYNFTQPYNVTVNAVPTFTLSTPYWENTNFPPDRQVDYMRDSGGSNVLCFAGGYLPVLDAVPQIRKNKTSAWGFLYTSKKAYPYFVNTAAFPGGTANQKITGVAYKKFQNLADSNHQIGSMYTIPYENDTYIYLDYHQAGNDAVTLAEEYQNRRITLVEKSDNIGYTQNASTIDVTVSDSKAYGYLVLKVGEKIIPELESACAELDFSMLTTESADAVTSVLDLSVAALAAKYPNVQITWQSDNAKAVIDSLTKKVIINRSVTDVKVTLTATLKVLSGESLTKNFEFTILKRGRSAVLDAAFNALTFDKLTSEQPSSITKDLDLSVLPVTSAYPQVYITWKSSDIKVISVHAATKKGIVTRPNADTSVSLTATLSVPGEAPIDKTFEMTVLNYNAVLCATENFNSVTESEIGKSIEKTALSKKGWTVESKALESEYLASVAADPKDSSNLVLKSHRIIGNSGDFQATRLNFNPTPKKNVVFSARVMVEAGETTPKTDTIFFRFYGKKGKTYSSIVEVQMLYRAAGDTLYATKDGSASVSAVTGLPAKGSWFNFEMRMNLIKGTYQIKLNNFLTSEISFKSAADTTLFDEFSHVVFNPYRTGEGSIVYVDDIEVRGAADYTGNDNQVFCAVNGTKAAIRTPFNNTQDLTQVVENIMPYATNTEYGVDFNTARLIEKTETNSFADGKALSGGNGTAPAFKINGHYLGAEYGQPDAVLVTAGDHGKGFEDIGSLWRDDNGVEWTLLRVADKDNLLFLSENIGASAYQYRFEDRIGGTLSFISDGLNQEKIVPSGQMPSQQIFPAAVYNEKSIYVVSKNDRIKLSQAGSAYGDYVEIVEQYDIINPATIAQTLRANRPSGGYHYEPSLAVGEKLVSYQAVHKIDKTGMVITTTNHLVKADTAKFSSFSYDAVRTAVKPDAYGGGVLRNQSLPNRESVYLLENGSRKAGFVCGLLPILDAKNKKINQTDSAFTLIGKGDLPKSVNPSFIPDSAFPEGKVDMSIKAVSHQAYFDQPNGTYQVSYNNQDFLYFDFIEGTELSTNISLNDREIIETDNPSYVAYVYGNGKITATAERTGDYLALKVGRKETDTLLARQFIEQNAVALGIDITDQDYIGKEDETAAIFLNMIQRAHPANKADIKGAFMKAMAVSSFRNLKVSEAEAKIMKYGDILGISSVTYREHCADYGTAEISKAFANKMINSPEEILSTYNNRIETLSKEKEDVGNQSSPGGRNGGGSGGSVNISKPAEMTTPLDTTPAFTDLRKEHWGADYMVKLAEMGILSGYQDGTIKPDDNVTREQFIKMLVLALDIYNADAACEFADVDVQGWSKAYIASGVDFGIVTGYQDDTFKPRALITRQDMAVMVHRAVKKAEIKLTDINQEAEFADGVSFADYAKESIQAMYMAGLVNGMGDNVFAPSSLLTRAQAAKIIYRICTLR